MPPKVHEGIKEFNAAERVRDGPVAHPQDAWSTLSLSISLWLTVFWLCRGVGWHAASLTQFTIPLEEAPLGFYQIPKFKVVARVGGTPVSCRQSSFSLFSFLRLGLYTILYIWVTRVAGGMVLCCSQVPLLPIWSTRCLGYFLLESPFQGFRPNLIEREKTKR